MNSDLQEGFIKLPNNWYDHLNITNEELTVLTLLYRNYLYYQSVSLCNIDMLCNYMYIDSNSNKRIVKSILDIINSLLKKELIVDIYNIHCETIKIDDIVNKHYTFYVELTPPPENAFFIVKNIDIDNIFNYLKNTNIGKFNLIRYFIACRRVCSNESNFGYLTQSKLKRLITDSKTVQRYNKILQDELHLIRYDNNYLTPDKHYCTTFIGSYEEKGSFNKMLKFEVDRQGLIYTDKLISNTKRSVTQQINNKSFNF